MKYGSLFSGVGGLDLAVARVFDADVAWHAEVGTAPAAVLAYHWPLVPNLGDVSEVDWHQVEPVDILCGGFPCQDVSAAGRRAGLGAGTRSGLWSYFADAIDALRPRVVVIENVRGLLNATANRHLESGADAVGDGAAGYLLRAAGAVLGDLADLGYDAQWATVAASSIGAPHRRDRVFVVAYPDDARPQRSQPAGGRQLPAGGAGAVDLLPTPTVALADGGQTSRSGARKDELLLSGIALDLLPTPEAKNSHAGPDYARMTREGSGGHDLVTAVAYHHLDVDWGRYGPAVHRWEGLLRPAPAPTELNSKGKPHLSPAFPEWMMGWEAGWVTDVGGLSREERLRCIGNGVVPQQAEAALRYLLSVG